MSNNNISDNLNPLAPDELKNSEEFGMKILKTCYNKWKNGFGTESWSARVQRFEKNRQYAAGRQNTDQYKDIVNADGQIAVLNLDYSPLPIAIPFLNRLKDRYMQRVEKIKCVAVDPFSQNKKREAKEGERFKLNYGDKIKQIQSEAGLELESFKEDDPRNEQELDIKFGFTYKEAEEILMELGIDLVFYDNKWQDVIKDRILEDIYTCGYAVVHTELDGSGKIKTPTVKPEYFITSYFDTQNNEEWQYNGQLRFMSIAEVRLRFPNKISEQELFNIANKYTGQYGNPSRWDYSWDNDYRNALARPWDGYTVPIVDLYYKTLYNLKYEKKEDNFGRELLKKPKTIRSDKEYEKSAPYYVAYHGVMIADSDHLLKWKLADNMLKPNDDLTEVYSPYSIFMHNNNKCSNTPLIETMIPSIDLMHNLHYKTLQIIAATAPDGADIDVSRLSEIDMGAGVGVVSPLALYGIYLQTGNRYYMGTGDDGVNDGKPPITPNNFQYSNKLEQLDAKWQREYEKLNVFTGSNNLDSGIITNQATATTTVNAAKQISASASNYVYNAYVNIMNGVAKNVSLRLWDKFVFGEGSFDGYTNALGKDNIEYVKLEATDDFEKTNFDVKIEAVIDDAAEQRLNQRIDMALANQQITIQDSIELDMIDNPRYKAIMLATRAKQKRAEDIKEARINSEENTKSAIAAANAKSEGDLKLAGTEHSNKKELMMLENTSEEQKEGYKFAGILKAKVVDAVLSKPGSTISDIPDFIWSGLNLTNDAQKQLMLQALQQIALQNQAVQQQQQMMAQTQQQQQGQPQQQIDPNQQQEMPQEQMQQVA